MQVPLLVDDFLRRALQCYAEKTAVVDGEVRLTYAELGERVNRFSQVLLALGVERGDRVCILSPNSHFFLESFYATSQIGAVLVPLNYRLVAADHAYILDHAGVCAVLVDWEYTQVVDSIRGELPGVRHWIAARDGGVDEAGWRDWETLIEGQPSEAGLRAAGALLHDRMTQTILRDFDEAAHLFDRSGGIYLDGEGVDWSDNPERFAALCRAGADICAGFTGWQPDLSHGHDWQAGLLPYL